MNEGEAGPVLSKSHIWSEKHLSVAFCFPPAKENRLLLWTTSRLYRQMMELWEFSNIATKIHFDVWGAKSQIFISY